MGLADAGKRELLARKSNDELLEMWGRRADYPPDTAAVLESLLSERGIAYEGGADERAARRVGEFRDLTGLAALLKGSLGVYMVVAMAGLWSGWMEIDILQRVVDGATVSEAEAAASDSRQALMGGLYLLAMIVTGVFFLRWTYLANRNARALGATGLEFTPGWAVGWYFVPVAWLWKPYQALKETFKASHPDFRDNWGQAPSPGMLPVWWTLWIISNYVGQAVFRVTLQAETVDAFLASSWITWVSDALDLPLGVAVIVLVAELQSRQSEKRRRLASVVV